MNVFKGFTDFVSPEAAALWSRLGTALGRLAEPLGALIGLLFNLATYALAPVIGVIDLLTLAIKGLYDGIKVMMDWLSTAVDDLFDWFGDDKAKTTKTMEDRSTSSYLTQQPNSGFTTKPPTANNTVKTTQQINTSTTIQVNLDGTQVAEAVANTNTMNNAIDSRINPYLTGGLS
jgi:hypothetical protein